MKLKNPFIGMFAIPITIIATAFMQDRAFSEFYVALSVLFSVFWFVFSISSQSNENKKEEK